MTRLNAKSASFRSCVARPSCVVLLLFLNNFATICFGVGMIVLFHARVLVISVDVVIICNGFKNC